MSKYTKGKWEAGEHAGIYGNGEQIATILYCINPKKPFEVMTEEAQANARLISAAPCLLEACKIVIMHLEPLKADDVFHELVIKECKQAITKAEGK